MQESPGKTIHYRSYKHYSKESFLADLRNENWDSIEESEDVNEAASIWSKMFLNVADRHAPVKQTRIKGNDVPWMSSDLKNSMHERNRLHRKAVKSKNPADWIKYKEVKNSVNMQVRKCKSDYYCNLIEESKNQPKSLWKHLNNITSRKSNSNVSSFSKLPSTNRVQNRYNHRLDSKYFIHDVTCSLPQQTSLSHLRSLAIRINTISYLTPISSL